jgi:hypothetical protein
MEFKLSIVLKFGKIFEGNSSKKSEFCFILLNFSSFLFLYS